MPNDRTGRPTLFISWKDMLLQLEIRICNYFFVRLIRMDIYALSRPSFISIHPFTISATFTCQGNLSLPAETGSMMATLLLPKAAHTTCQASFPSSSNGMLLQ
ncbi:hypothetical protein [Bacillus sp. 1P06AnD]|uniref:hypothetical protein n=1 Tax=Bacillus sp. 1P06AnD TaxID=3132208 RepID=UPI0039A03707